MVTDQKGHATRHESGGGDELGLGGLVAADDANVNFGSDSDFQFRFDSANNRFELFDNVNDVDVFRVSPSSTFVLRNRNLDLSDNSLVGVDLVDGVNVSSHASRHSDGGGDELDAAELAGGLGTNGQILQSDGSAASWVDFQSGSDVSDDGSLVVSAPSDINFGSQLDVTDDGDSSVTVDANVSTESTTTVSSSYTTQGETTVFMNGSTTSSSDGFENGDFTSNPSWNTVSSGGSTLEVNNNDSYTGSFSVESEAGLGSVNEIEVTGRSIDFSKGASLSCAYQGDGFATQPTGPAWKDSSSGAYIRYETTSGFSSGGLVINDGTNESSVSTADTVSDIDSDNGNWGFITITRISDTELELRLQGGGNNVDVTYVYDETQNSASIPDSFDVANLRHENDSGISGIVRLDDMTISSSANIPSVTLSSSDVSDGKIVRAVDINGIAGSIDLTVDTEGSETINGEPDAVLNNNYEALTFQSDGSNWFVVSRVSGGDTT